MKKNIAFWSYGTHLKKRVIPSISKNKNIIPKAIFSKKNKEIKKNQYLEKIKIYSNKKKFLLDNTYDTIYISSVNSNHYKNCIDALTYNKNIICEKPIALKPKEVKKILNLARKKKLIVHEMFQYTFHPLFLEIKKILRKNILGKLKFVESKFTIPLNDKNNFRFKKSLGGGSLNDSGIYPLSLNVFLFNNLYPKILKSKIIISKKNKIDLMGSILIKKNNLLFNQEWGFNLDYQNYLKIFGSKGEMITNFVFSKKINQIGIIKIKIKNNKNIIKTKKANQINLAFNNYLNKKNTHLDNTKMLSLSQLIYKTNLVSKKIKI